MIAKSDFLEGLRFTHIYERHRFEIDANFSLKYLLSLSLDEIFFHNFASIYQNVRYLEKTLRKIFLRRNRLFLAFINKKWSNRSESLIVNRKIPYCGFINNLIVEKKEIFNGKSLTSKFGNWIIVDTASFRNDSKFEFMEKFTYFAFFWRSVRDNCSRKILWFIISKISRLSRRLKNDYSFRQENNFITRY